MERQHAAILKIIVLVGIHVIQINPPERPIPTLIHQEMTTMHIVIFGNGLTVTNQIIWITGAGIYAAQRKV